MSAEIKTTLGDGRYKEALEALREALAPGGDWTEAERAAAAWESEQRLDGAKKRWASWLKRSGLEKVAAEIESMEVTGSEEHKRFIGEYLKGYEGVFNRKAPGMFVSGDTGIGKTYNAVMFTKLAFWSPDFQKNLKTEWNGELMDNPTPATVMYLTSMALIERLERTRSWSQGETREAALSEICSHDIVIVDDVGMPSGVGKTNAEVSAINAVMKAMPTGLILQTRLPLAAFNELFGESAADIARRWCKPSTFGCQSRRTWGKK